MPTEHQPHGTSSASADADNLAQLIDIIVFEDCELDRVGMTPAQTDALARIGAIAWASRDIARRLADKLHTAPNHT